ncbi:hypothetical protein BX600DRAFT_440787 [Xylariales sp. PMI_506]|nr:hypothetical protein BX600DRAFT_440787 [Xylariales sp. PMI_506]
MHPSRLELLPRELFLRIASFLEPGDLAALAVTSQNLNHITSPALWIDIDTHSQQFHEIGVEINLPAPHVPPSRRPCFTALKGHDYGPQRSYKLYSMLSRLAATDPARLAILAARPCSLCTEATYKMPINQNGDAAIAPGWNLLPRFTNLTRLELHANWERCEDEPPFNASSTPLPGLRFVKLCGYIPRQVIQWIVVSHASRLEILELGLLDRPVGSILVSDRFNPPLPHERVSYNVDGSDDDNKNEDEDADAGSAHGSLDDEIISPRPLPFLDGVQMPNLPRLRHLQLSRPSRKVNDDEDFEYAWSRRAAQAAVEDWKCVLNASHGTLETLTLEHRVVAQDIEGDACGSCEYVGMYSTESAEDTFLSLFQETEFPHLSKIYLYGMLASQETPKGLQEEFAHIWQGRQVTCEARLGRWCRFDYETGEVEWDWYNGIDPDEEWDRVVWNV